MQVGDFVYGDYAEAVLDGLGGVWNVETIKSADDETVEFGVNNSKLVSLGRLLRAGVPEVKISGDTVLLRLSNDPGISSRVVSAIISFIKLEVSRYDDAGYKAKTAENKARTSR